MKSDHVAPVLSKYKLPVEITILDDLSEECGRQDRQTRPAATARQHPLTRPPDTTLKPTTQHTHRRTEMGFTTPDFPDVDPEEFLAKLMSTG